MLALFKRFQRGPLQPTVVNVGQLRVCAIVNAENPLRELTVEQVTKALSQEGEALQWKVLGGSGGVVKCYVQRRDSWAYRIVREACLAVRENKFGEVSSYRRVRADVCECDHSDEVLQKVRQDVFGLGFVQANVSIPQGVRIVEVKANSVKASAYVDDRIRQDGNPLSEYVILYVHPEAPPAAKVFANYSIGEHGSAIAQKYGLVTPHMLKEAEGISRMAEAKAGKGPKLAVVGVEAGNVVSDIVAQYVCVRQVVQLTCVPFEHDVPAVATFIPMYVAGTTSVQADTSTTGPSTESPSAGAQAQAFKVSASTTPAVAPQTSWFVAAGGKELLLLTDKPSDTAMKIHGEKWNALGLDERGRPNGAGPAEYMLAGRGEAVILNSGNKVDSLSLAQLRAIFAGEIADWKTIGAGNEGKVAFYALKESDPAAKVVAKELLPVEKFRPVSWKKESAEAISAVSSDPNGIAFVDVTAIPKTGQMVKVLGIRMGTPGQEKVFYPTPDTIRNATYPLSQRLFMYVHPQASETAKDFAKFIATCGQSAESPYFDTVSQVAETYRKNGLVPLGIEPAKLKYPTTAPWTEDAPVNKALKAASRPTGAVAPSPEPTPTVGKVPTPTGKPSPTAGPSPTPIPTPASSDPPRVTPAPRSR